MTKDGAEEAAADALILAAKRDFGVVIDDFNFSNAEGLRKENESLRRTNLMLKSDWVQSVDHLETVRQALEQITVAAVSGSSGTSIGVLAHGAVVWAEESGRTATSAVEDLCTEWMDEN